MYTTFTDLDIFADERLNTYLDTIYNAVLKEFPNEQLPVLCGSVAKVMQGVYSENYIVKDIDLIVEHWQVHRYLEHQLPLLFPNDRIEIRTERVILYTQFIAIEFWRPNEQIQTSLYKNLIKYKRYAY